MLNNSETLKTEDIHKVESGSVRYTREEENIESYTSSSRITTSDNS